jgi:hypothetical protein
MVFKLICRGGKGKNSLIGDAADYRSLRFFNVSFDTIRRGGLLSKCVLRYTPPGRTTQSTVGKSTLCSKQKKSSYSRVLLSSEWSRRGGLAALNPCTNVQWMKAAIHCVHSLFFFFISQKHALFETKKKQLPKGTAFIRVESEGFEPSSKQWELKLSTCLFPD